MAAERWKLFELATAALLQALDPKARVTHDAMIPDADKLVE